MNLPNSIVRDCILGLLCTVGLVVGCSSEKPEPVSSDAVNSVPADAGVNQWTPPVVTLPRLTRKGGKRPVEVLLDMEVEADEWGRDSFGTYVRVSVPSGQLGLIHGAPGGSRLVVSGSRHGFAVPGGEGIKRDRPWFLVRFEGTEKLPDSFEVMWHQAAQLNGDPGRVQKITINGTRNADRNPDIIPRFYEAAGIWFLLRGWVSDHRLDPFHAYAAALSNALSRRGGSDVGRDLPRRPELERLSEPADIMAVEAITRPVHSALLARSSFQSKSSGIQRGRDLDLEPAPVRRFPWKKIAAALPQNSQPSVESLSRLAPSDALFLHLHWGGVRSDWRPWFASFDGLTNLFMSEPGLPRLPGALRRLLGSKLTERVLAGQVKGLKSMALISRDPLASAGCDLTVLFDATQSARAELMEALPVAGGAQKKSRVHGQTLVSSATGKLERHRTVLGRTLVVSNSMNGMRTVIEAGARKTSTWTQHGARILSDTEEYQYFRTRKPFQADESEFFAFVGQDFWRRYLSPSFRIATMRRRLARAELAAVDFAAVYHGWLSGGTAQNIKSLLRRGFLTSSDLKHDYDGARIRLNDDGRAESSWGTADAMVPGVDLTVDEISDQESGAYQRFSEFIRKGLARYQTSAAFHAVDDGKRVNGQLDFGPLYWKSAYRGLLDFVGAEVSGSQRPGPGLRFELSVDEKSGWRTALDGLIRTRTDHRNINLQWLGHWLALGVVADGGLLDGALSLGELLTVEGRNQLRQAELRKSIIARLPIYGQFHIKDRRKLNRAIEALEIVGKSVAPDALAWQSVAPHSGVQINRVGEVLSDRAEQQAGIYYAIVDDVLLASFHHETLISLIDGTIGKASRGAPSRHASLEWQSNDFLESSLNGLEESRMVLPQRAVARAWEAAVVGGKDALARGLILPQGGHFSLGADGTVSHSQYGSETEPLVPMDFPTGRWFPARGVELRGTIESAADHRLLTVGFETARP